MIHAAVMEHVHDVESYGDGTIDFTDIKEENIEEDISDVQGVKEEIVVDVREKNDFFTDATHQVNENYGCLAYEEVKMSLTDEADAFGDTFAETNEPNAIFIKTEEEVIRKHQSPLWKAIKNPGEEEEDDSEVLICEEEKDPLFSVDCGNTCSSDGNQATFKENKEVAGEGKRFRCEVCGKKFMYKSWLQDHTRGHTKEKPFSCGVCGKLFTWKTDLMKHTRTHTKEKPYICQTCDKSFSEKGTLMCHIRVHTKEKPFRCEICNKDFSNRGNLVQHTRIHTQEKPHGCEVCSKAFSVKSKLLIHMRVHTKEKPYRCEVCKKAFAVKYNLVQHLRVHTQDKPFRCVDCSKSFACKRYLVKHMRLHA